MKLKKGDKVRVVKGKDSGKEGAVERVWPKNRRVTIAGVNLFKRHMKPRAEGQKGGIVDFVRPLPVSDVALVCPKCKQLTRVGYKITDHDKVRICRKCEQEI